MRKTSGMRIVLFAAALAATGACKLNEDQQAAVDACQRWGQARGGCDEAKRALAEGLEAAGKKPPTKEQFAELDACKVFANAQELCAYANRNLASGAAGIAKSLRQQQEAFEDQRRRDEAAEAQQAEIVAKGGDPCRDLREQIAKDHSAPACAEKIESAVGWLQDDPGCAAALADAEGTALTVGDMLGDCDGEAP